MRVASVTYWLEMPSDQSPSNTVPAAVVGGIVFAHWVLGDDVRTINTKAGTEKTVLSLRDPRRLADSVTVWLDGPAGDLADAQPGEAVTLHVAAVRPGRERGELVADVTREAVEAAFRRKGA